MDRAERIDRFQTRSDHPGVLDQPEGGRLRAEPDRRRHGDPLRSVVEPGRRRPGLRPRAPHRPEEGRHRLPPGRRRHDRREDPRSSSRRRRTSSPPCSARTSGREEAHAAKTSTTCSAPTPAFARRRGRSLSLVRPGAGLAFVTCAFTQSATVIELANIYGGENAVPRLAGLPPVLSDRYSMLQPAGLPTDVLFAQVVA